MKQTSYDTHHVEGNQIKAVSTFPWQLSHTVNHTHITKAPVINDSEHPEIVNSIIIQSTSIIRNRLAIHDPPPHTHTHTHTPALCVPL